MIGAHRYCVLFSSVLLCSLVFPYVLLCCHVLFCSLLFSSVMVLIDGDRCALVQCMKSALFDDVNGSESTLQCKHLVDLN